VLLAAGDIADCNVLGDARATAALVRHQPADAIVVTLGDNAYPDGSPADFRDCYDPTWGRFAARTHPAAGNHDWVTRGAAGYRGYFGDSAGAGDATWYGFSAGDWRVVVLDSDCWAVGGCGPKSPQGRWLAAEIEKEAASAAAPAACQLAIWHHPFASSGLHGDTATSRPLWTAVVDGGFDLVLGGHDHHYERFAPLDREGRPAVEGAGAREFVVGTGGAGLYPVLVTREGSEHHEVVHGILRLELLPGSYRWQFLATPDGAVLDQGEGDCH
jgi:hypothetical protein